ncbi:MCE family protein [Mycobacterium sp. 663a-19]|uniref:MCE family protein n=1 Tax=Mycobacterium sp. 663a-19 TaxID=2986148 RepID=UPI002D1E5D72|nr:MCE family protein [Mycobacterium sp. 663a-19]MEB3980058.1 MCE family protein [Mycobacterium sp. 663a-19]
MIGAGSARRLLVAGGCAMFTVTGCAFHGLNSLPLPGAVGRGPAAQIFHVEIANVGTLESNSPVMIGNVVVGSVGKMTVRDWHADVDVSVSPGIVVAANAVATVGQTSLLGSMHLALDPPSGQPPVGRLESGATIALNRSSTYPSTEQTLASLSTVINGGGLGQIGDIVHNFSAALSGHQDAVRDLISRLDTVVGTLDQQRDNLIASIQQLNRLSATLGARHEVIAAALHKIPPALDVLIKEKPRLITALDKLRVFTDTATAVVNDTQADLVKNLQNLEPTIRALADIGPGIDDALAAATVFPWTQNIIDRGLRGDYFNLFIVMDLTVTRLRRELLLGTHWGVDGAELVPASGDPGYDWFYTKNPLGGLVAIPPEGSGPPPLTGSGGLGSSPWPGTLPPQPEGVAPPPSGQPLPPAGPPPPPVVNLPPPWPGGSYAPGGLYAPVSQPPPAAPPLDLSLSPWDEGGT